ncbi:MAG: glycerol dehydrogenase [Pseudomonadota bacterium]
MIRALIAPRRYVQGAGALSEAGKLVGALGKKVLLVMGPNVREAVGGRIAEALEGGGVEVAVFPFSGESSKGQVAAGAEAGRLAGATVVIGAGGGKAVDTARAIAATIGAAMVSLPTIASNDSPTSAVTVYYTDDGVLDGFDVWPGNPDLVLVDTALIAKAPVRWLISGMGDALATWFEAEAAYKGRRQALSGGVPTMAALSLARLCHETLLEYGLAARRAVEKQVVTPALERIVEANILLSGLGWESGGLATAHTLGNGLTIVPATHALSHGEKVAFGLATQLCLDDDIDEATREEVFGFMIELGLPVTLAEAGLGELTEAELRAVAAELSAPGQFLHNHVFTVTADSLFGAMIDADAYATELRSRMA